MTIETHLIHRCTILRPSVEVNPYGEDATQSLAVVASGVRCRLVVKSQEIRDSNRAEAPRVARYVLLLERSAPIAKGDTVRVTYEDGQVVPTTFRMESVMPRRSSRLYHISCDAVRVD